jgi:predicted membrane protein
MKMNFAILVGILFVLIGISIILRTVLNIDIPIVKIFFAVILIYIGVRMLTGPFAFTNIKSGENAVIFGESTFRSIPKENEYKILFGHGKIDLQDVDSTDIPEKLTIHVLFGGADLYLDKDIPVKIKSDAAFAKAEMPDGRNTSFGNIDYENSGDSTRQTLYIESHVVFGEFQAFHR